MTARETAIVILGEGSLATARRIQSALPGACIFGLAGRTTGVDIPYSDFGEKLRELFLDDVPIVALCAAGIVIRTLAPLLQNKRAEPPVLAVAEDGSAVVPLLGGLRGVNAIAQKIGAALGAVPAITTTGEVRFGATLEAPPAGYELRNPADSKRFMSDLLAGNAVVLSGNAPWLADTHLPFANEGPLSIRVTSEDHEPRARELVFHPRSLAIGLAAGNADLPALVLGALARHRLAPQAVGVLLAAERDVARAEIHAVGAALDRPVRFLPEASTHEALLEATIPARVGKPLIDGPVAIVEAASPIVAEKIGRARGRLAVVGLGPGKTEWMAPEARRLLATADDIVGYETYVRMAGPFLATQRVHMSDNREELDRARHALSLAALGRAVAVVSSGDPGIFAMATAVMEALHKSDDPAWAGVEITVIPGISAAQGAAARIGAPLGHDFCVLSLSDNLKPWKVIERRLDSAAAADLVLALYNPISRNRPWQLGQALKIIARHRSASTPVIVGRDVGRPDENVRVVALSSLSPSDVDMRTVLIVGSTTTMVFPRIDGGVWTYTPRTYGEPEAAEASNEEVDFPSGRA